MLIQCKTPIQTLRLINGCMIKPQTIHNTGSYEFKTNFIAQYIADSHTIKTCLLSWYTNITNGSAMQTD